MFARNARLGILLAAVAVLFVAAGAARGAQFGRNKIQYESFDWQIIRTEHFDVYYYDGSEDVADAVCRITEESNDALEELFGHELTTVIPIIVYASNNEFQQTNVLTSHIGEGVGGFTELFKNRVVIPFTGSYYELRHVIHHEMTHVFMFDIVYRGLAESVIRQAYFNPVPLWFAEGLAEFASQGWDTQAEMILRDLTTADAVVPLEYLYGGYLVYKEGQSALNFIAERYGREKVRELVRLMARTQNLERSLREATGLTTAELNEEWVRWLRHRYWPEISGLDRVKDQAKLLTDHGRDRSYFNVGPAVSPDGNSVVFLSDRSGYADVYHVSTLDGATLGRVIKGERNDAFEQMHILRIGFSWSPDGTQICFGTKAGGSDAIHIVRVNGGGLVRSLEFDLDGVYTPVWSPDGERIAFVGTKGGASELYVTDVMGKTLVRLTDDYDDERDPEWSPDGLTIAFASDRDSRFDRGFDRSYDLYAVDVATKRVTLLVRGPGWEQSPAWSPDGRYLVYSSDRLGTPDLYMADLEDSTCVRLSSFVGGAEAPSWSREGDRLVFAAYEEGGWDVAVVKSPLSHFAEAIKQGERFPMVGDTDLPEPFDHYQDTWVDVADMPEDADESDEVGAADRETTGDEDLVIFGRDGEAAAEDAAEDVIFGRDGEAAAEDVRSEAPAEADTGLEFMPRPEPPELKPGPDSEHRVESDAVKKARSAYTRATGQAPPSIEEEERHAGSVERYTPKFTPDWIDGGFSYSSAYGFGGTAEIAVSDILGNHRFYIASDFFSSFEFSNAHIMYEYLAKRVNYSVAVYSYREYYYSDRTRLGEDLGEKRYFTERNYGMSVGLTYPFSHFSRVELDVSGMTMTRRFAEENDEGDIELTDEEIDRTLLIPGIRLVNDTTLWGSVGPISGGRSSFALSKSIGIGDEFSFLTGIADFRRYMRIGARHSLATKLVLARSSQADAQTFYVGGVNSVRGYDDFEFSGHNVALLSVEFRYPFIDNLTIASPIPLSIWGLRGVMFADLGAAWDDEFRGVARGDAVRFQDIKASYGIGARMRFGYFILRYDLAWPTDLQTKGDPVSHFAIGAEF